MRDTERTEEDWSMSERRERAVMRDVPNVSAPPILPEANDFKLPTARGILSKEEIQALLRPDLPKINDAGDTSQPFGRDLDAREEVNEAARDGRKVAARLSRAFGEHAGLKAAVTLANAASFEKAGELRTYAEETATNAFAIFENDEGDATHIICLSNHLNDQLVANACGALSLAGSAARARHLSVIDCALIRQFMSPFGRLLGQGLSLVGIETNAAYVSSLMAGDAGARFDFNVDAAGRRSAMSLWTVEVATAERQTSAPVEPARGAQDATALLTARMASLSVPVSKLAALKQGDTLLLGLPADQPVQLLSGGRDGRVAYEGDLGRKGNSMAVRLRQCA